MALKKNRRMVCWKSYCWCGKGMKLRIIYIMTVLLLLSQNAYAQQEWLTMDMVHNNPGEPPTQTQFTQPDILRAYGYDSQVFFLFDAAQFGVDWQVLNADVLPEGSKEYEWMMEKRLSITQKYDGAKRAGLRVYCMLDMLVLPRRMTEVYADSLLNDKGKIDIQKPFTQKCVRLLMQQMFQQFPQLDGLVIRTGETYLNDAPYYVGNHPVQNELTKDHITLIQLLREEVCEKLQKDIFYRTWDFGQFHSLPQWYLTITNQITPHEHLYFSIKHTMTDFWRGAIPYPKSSYDDYNAYWIGETSHEGNPFNPTIGIGNHQQIIEVQCQREYEGKAVHVNYIAKGVIDGFQEYRDAQMPHPYCLSDLKEHNLICGIWTWTRGGGWGGPYLKNEFWVELNAYVVSQWAKHRNLSEREIFAKFARSKGLPESEIETFHQLCLLSLDGVIKGQYSTMGNTWVNWTRDNKCFDKTQESFMCDIIKEGRVKAYSKEKREAVKIWRKIDKLAKKLHFPDEELNEYVRNSCTYALLKYKFFAASWDYEITLLKPVPTVPFRIMNRNLKRVEASWREWNEFLKEKNMEEAGYVDPQLPKKE